MSRLYTAFGIALLFCLSLAGTAPAQEANPQPSVADRTAALNQRIEDLRSDMKFEEDQKNLAQKHYDEAQIAIRDAIQLGRTPVAEQFMANDAMRDKRQAESNIRRLQSEIRGSEMELRQLAVDERNRQQGTTVLAQKPVEPADGKTSEEQQRINAELKRLKGSWRGQTSGLMIDGDKVRIVWSVEGIGLQYRDARIEIDPESGFLDFHADKGHVFLQLYRIQTLENGKTVLITQNTRGNMTVRPREWKMLWQVDPGEGEVFEKITP